MCSHERCLKCPLIRSRLWDGQPCGRHDASVLSFRAKSAALALNSLVLWLSSPRTYIHTTRVVSCIVSVGGVGVESGDVVCGVHRKSVFDSWCQARGVVYPLKHRFVLASRVRG